MKRALLMAALALAGCVTSSPQRAPLSVDALIANAPAYVAQRYRPSELPSALIADLTAIDFQCQHSATASECGRAQHAFASCWDVVTVRISATAPVEAGQARRCMGVSS